MTDHRYISVRYFIRLCIADIGESLPENAKKIIDAKGNLVTESFVNGHLHLCKVYTLEKAGQKALQEYQQGGIDAVGFILLGIF